jgi:hypothetical protein
MSSCAISVHVGLAIRADNIVAAAESGEYTVENRRPACASGSSTARTPVGVLESKMSGRRGATRRRGHRMRDPRRSRLRSMPAREPRG